METTLGWPSFFIVLTTIIYILTKKRAENKKKWFSDCVKKCFDL